MRPKRFALKSSPHPTVILECVVAEPVAAAAEQIESTNTALAANDKPASMPTAFSLADDELFAV